MQKIAVPVQGDNVSAHFGHAPHFKIYNIEENSIKKEEILENPGHQPGLLPKLLNEAGADVIIASGMGQKAITLFESNDIKVVCGASGEAKTAVEKYLGDQLDTSENACSHEDHSH